MRRRVIAERTTPAVAGSFFGQPSSKARLAATRPLGRSIETVVFSKVAMNVGDVPLAVMGGKPTF